MSEKPSEDLKRICLICGCHTNQTINIYEPRSGPNIIQLIQAKFKFQPINEDKFLCYSCNNWLINWHSLQAVNSNEEEVSESQSSGKIRNQINNESIPEEQLEKNILTSFCLPPLSKKRNSFNFSKRSSLVWSRIRRSRRPRNLRCRSMCGLCGSLILHKNGQQKLNIRRLINCRKCRRILKWRSDYLNSILEEENSKLKQIEAQKQQIIYVQPQNLVNHTNCSQIYTSTYKQQKYQRPLIDGKVVSMLRRLGTTLTRESSETEDRKMPQIMSPRKKQKQIWSREIEKDEILIDFNTAITEVLSTKKMLTYQISSEDDGSSREGDNNNNKEIIDLEDFFCKIPNCLTVSIINDEEEVCA